MTDYHNNVFSYFAGALDGDGSFSLIKKKEKDSISVLYYPLIQLANADREMTDLMHRTFGGSLHERKEYIGKDGSSRIKSFTWKIEKSRCELFLRQMIPFLIIKKERAEFLLNYCTSNHFERGKRITDEKQKIRQSSHDQMIKFNKEYKTSCVFESSEIVNDAIFWSYVAGIMDTDGSFSIKKESTRLAGGKGYKYRPIISLSMNDCRAIYYIASRIPSVKVIEIKAKTSNTGKQYRMQIEKIEDVKMFLKNIHLNVYGFLLIKKPAMTILNTFCMFYEPTKHCRAGISQKQQDFRESCYQKIKAFNNRHRIAVRD